jgi:DNA-binding NtrC family response regulator
VLVASDGLAALDLWRELRGRIRCLVSDIVMPGLSGLELAARCVAEHPALRVVLISGHVPADGELNSALLRRPLTTFVAKPFHPHELLAQIENLIGPTRATSHADAARANATPMPGAQAGE